MTQLGSNAQLGSNVQMGVDPGFNPLWLSGCVAWFDMHDPRTYTTNSSARLLSLTNKASGVVWTEATVGPFLTTVNSQPAMQFNGSNKIQSTEAEVVAALNGDTSYTIFAVIQENSLGNAMFLGCAKSSSNNGFRCFGTNTNGTVKWTVNGNTAGGAIANIFTTADADTSQHVYEAWAPTTTTASIAIDGTVDPSGASQALGATTCDRVALGCRPRMTTDLFWSGSVQEVLIFNRTLTDFERAVVRTYLLRKWGIADPSPLTILGSLAWWVRADQGITIATGVSQWNDLSGNGVNFTQATTNFQPAFTPSAIGGQPAVTADGVADRLSATWTRAAPGTQPFYIWQVACPLVWGANRSFLGDFVSSTGFIIRQTVGSPQVTQYCNADRNANGGGPVGTWSRYESYFANTTGDYQKIGTTATTGQNAGNMAGGGTVTFFTRGDGNGFGNISTAEAFAFLGTPTTAQRAWLDAYAYLRYGPTLNVG